MKQRIITTALIISLALNGAVLATFGYHWLQHRRWHSGHGRIERHLQKTLGLTTEQAAAMEKNRQAIDAATAPIKTALHAKRTELFALLETETTYSPRIDALVAEIARLQADMERQVIRHSMDTGRILTPEQQKRFHSLLRRGFNKRGSRPETPPEQPK